MEQQGVGVASDDLVSPDDGLESAVLRLVREDPFASIREIRNDLRRRSDFRDVGWWKVFGILRKNRLLRRRSRFRFMRGI